MSKIHDYVDNILLYNK